MICTVGLTCLDIVSFVNKFPGEDTDSRCTKQTWERGGNASNDATVMASLGQPVEYFGTFANDHFLSFFQSDMDSFGIKHQNCPIIEGIAKAPASVVICSEETGSRTIIHSRGTLPEIALEDFKARINLTEYSWIHFEGRNETEVSKMMETIQEFNAQHPKQSPVPGESSLLSYRNVRLPISVEVEKSRDSLAILLPLAHVLFVGKEFAILQGAKDCLEAAKIISGKVKAGTLIICPWGDQGAAYCVAIEGELIETDVKKMDAFQPTKIMDSLGAGDTFIASTVYCLHKGLDVETSVRAGCKLASQKLTMYGFRGIKDVAAKMPEFNK